MTFLDAAYQILRQVGQPLHYTEITARALSANLIDTEAQTLEAELLDASGWMRYQGAAYRSPSRAGWKSCNGWRFWLYWEPESGEWRAIDALRE